MLKLPALETAERAYLESLQRGGALTALANRLGQRLVAMLGTRVSVSAVPFGMPAGGSSGDEPEIRIDAELRSAWLAVRFGGKPGETDTQLGSEALCAPFQRLLRRVLAETAVNLGPEAAWPQALVLNVSIGGRQGNAEIFWNSVHAMAWARHAIREKP
jgi:hypothetical protein